MYVDQKLKKHLAEIFLVCSNVFAIVTLNTLKLFWTNVLLFFINVHKKCVFYHFKIKIKKKKLFVLSICVISYSMAFQYPCYKKCFVDGNPKKKVFQTWKNSKEPQKYHPKKFSV